MKIGDWVRLENGESPPMLILSNPSDLNANGFVTEDVEWVWVFWVDRNHCNHLAELPTKALIPYA